MQLKVLATALFTALAAAHPSPTEAGEAVGPAAPLESATATDGPGGPAGEMSTMAQVTWQARGGCLRQYSNVQTCLSQCKDEASGGKCTNWKSITAVRTGGCCCGWYTCQCVCEH